jgi:hypothetical protein
MSITVTWDNSAHTTVRWDFVDHWEWEEFLLARQQSIALIQSVPHRVSVILEVSRSPSLPPGILGKFITYRRSDPTNMDQVVLVGMSRSVRTAVEMFNRIFPAAGGQVAFADTMQHARALLTADNSI